MLAIPHGSQNTSGIQQVPGEDANTCCFKRFGRGRRPGQSMYLMPLIRQPECQVFTDKTSSSCNENSHTGPSPVYELIAPRLISSTIGGSSKALVSPRLEVSPSATFRRMRPMIFPEAVLDRRSHPLNSRH